MTDYADPPVVLAWEAGPECARHDSVLDTVARLVSAQKGGVAHVTARARVKRLETGYEVLLETEQLGEKGERRFEGATCDQVADATALVLSVMLAPVETAETTIGATAETPPAPAPVPPPPARRDEPSEAPAPFSSKVSLTIGPRAGYDLGSLPAATAFFGVEIGADIGATRLSLSGAAWLPRDVMDGSHGVHVGLAAFAARGCRTIAGHAVAFQLCLGGELGRSTGQGFGIEIPRSSSAWWIAVVPGVALRTRREWLPAVLALDAPVALVHPSYEIEPYGEVFRSSRVVLRLTLGVDWSF